MKIVYDSANTVGPALKSSTVAALLTRFTEKSLLKSDAACGGRRVRLANGLTEFLGTHSDGMRNCEQSDPLDSGEHSTLSSCIWRSVALEEV